MAGYGSSYTGNITFGTPVDAKDRQLRGAKSLAETYGNITYDRDQIEKVFLDNVQSEYDAKRREYGRTAQTYSNRLAQSQNAYLDAMRKQAAQQATQSGAAYGAQAANRLSAVLGMSGQTSEDATKLVQQERALIDQEQQARTQAIQKALEYANQQKLALGNLDAQLYGFDAQKYVGELAANAQVGAANVAASAQGYTADKGLEGTRYAADQNLSGVRYTADQNLRGVDLSSGRQLEGTKYSADQILAGTRYTADQNLVGNKYTADQNLAGNKYTADQNLAGQQYVADKNFESTKYSVDANTATARYTAGLAYAKGGGGSSNYGGYGSAATYGLQQKYVAELNAMNNKYGSDATERIALNNSVSQLILQGMENGELTVAQGLAMLTNSGHDPAGFNIDINKAAQAQTKSSVTPPKTTPKPTVTPKAAPKPAIAPKQNSGWTSAAQKAAAAKTSATAAKAAAAAVKASANRIKAAKA